MHKNIASHQDKRKEEFKHVKYFVNKQSNKETFASCTGFVSILFCFKMHTSHKHIKLPRVIYGKSKSTLVY